MKFAIIRVGGVGTPPRFVYRSPFDRGKPFGDL